jgi:23S rRNA pseudouridine1911/1915/1917 synthase
MSKWSYTVKPSDEGYPIKKILKRNFSFSSRMMNKLKQNDCIRLGDEPVRVSVLPDVGDIITISLPLEKCSFTPENIPIVSVFEDDDLLIIDKPAGYVVHPTKGHPAHTIANGLAKYMKETGQEFKIRFINRLDMDTTGLLLVAKNAFCQEEIVRQMGENKVEKKYTAVVKGILKQNEGTIDAPIGLTSPDTIHRCVTEEGHASETHYRVMESFKRGFSLVELSLKTGRTHQIRVHLSHIGHPVIGDYLYGGENPLLIERQALHAHYVSFCHPITGGFTEVNSHIPDDIKRLLEKIKEPN